jgi:hypothetical protein
MARLSFDISQTERDYLARELKTRVRSESRRAAYYRTEIKDREKYAENYRARKDWTPVLRESWAQAALQPVPGLAALRDRALANEKVARGLLERLGA